MTAKHRQFGPDLMPARHMRCAQNGRSRRTGTIISDLYSGYVTVQWDSGRTESYVYMADIRPEVN